MRPSRDARGPINPGRPTNFLAKIIRESCPKGNSPSKFHVQLNHHFVTLLLSGLQEAVSMSSLHYGTVRHFCKSLKLTENGGKKLTE